MLQVIPCYRNHFSSEMIANPVLAPKNAEAPRWKHLYDFDLKEPSDALAARIQGDDFGKDGDLIQQCRMQRSSGPIVRRSQIEKLMKQMVWGP